MDVNKCFAMLVLLLAAQWAWAQHDSESWRQALAMRDGGMEAQAQQRLKRQLQQARTARNNATVVRVLIALSDLARIQADVRKASRYLDEAWQQAGDLHYLPADVIAELYVQRANLRALRDKAQYAQAQADYQQALEHAKNPALRGRIQANLARLWVTVCGDEGADMVCDFAQAQIDTQAAWQAGETLIGAEQAEHQLHLLDTVLALSTRHPPFATLVQQWFTILDPMVWSVRQRFFLYHYQAQWQERNNKLDAALLLAQQAYFAAQEDQSQELLYRGAYQLGRLWRARSHQTQNSEAHRKAIFYLTQALENWKIIMPQWLRAGFGAEYPHNAVRRNFRATPEGELYYILAEALLQDNPDEIALRTAAVVLEQFKKTALVDYYRDDCLALAGTADCQQQTPLDLSKESTPGGDNFCIAQSQDSALFYPLVFDDHLELILWRGTQPGQRIRIPQTRSSLQEQIKQLLEQLRKPLALADGDSVLIPAQALYDVLLRPFAIELRDVHTLIIVPDSTLLPIPFGVLHDGQQYLVERHALAVQLYRRKPTVAHAAPRVLLAALPPTHLPMAEQEVQQIAQLYAAKNIRLLSGEDYSRAALQQNLQQHSYDIVHIASHAQYQPEIRNSLLQAGDGNIQLEELQRWLRQAYYRGHPADLVVFSACQTAQGEDRAMLGLAGSALEAHAHSVAASLWKVEDVATCVLMFAFHAYLRQGVGKAQALRQAQLDLLRGTPTNHCSALAQPSDFSPPHAWAGFILIGDP